MPAVSVVVPVYNAARTLDATLASAAAQTLSDIEIIVVDDGSSDGSGAIVDRAAAVDRRIRLIRTANGGVAAARNVAIAAAGGAYVAPLDADDLWHPEKLARQVDALERGGPDVALAYSWHRAIGPEGRVVQPSTTPRIEGVVLHRHLAWNFIGNGSSPLIRRTALGASPYSSALREAGNEGCEDYLLQMQIACRFRFACVPAFLVAYRRSPDSMSADNVRMVRSRVQALEMLAPLLPPSAAPVARRETAWWLTVLAKRLYQRGDRTAAREALEKALRTSRLYTGRTALHLIRKTVSALEDGTTAGGDRPSRPFESFGPEEPFDARPAPDPMARRMAALRRLDETYTFSSR